MNKNAALARMNTKSKLWVSILVLFPMAPALAGVLRPDAPQTPHSSHAADPAAAAVVAMVERFSVALKAGDMGTVAGLLAPDVVILESGGVERSRAEYLAHHAGADAAFLRDARVEPGQRVARVGGDLAWVASESETQVVREGKPTAYLGTETMILERAGDGWRIVHIHWSSRARKETAK